MDSLSKIINKKELTDDELKESCQKYIDSLDNAKDILSIFQNYGGRPNLLSFMSSTKSEPRSQEIIDKTKDMSIGTDAFNELRSLMVPMISYKTRIPKDSVLQMLKLKSLKLYSSYGLTPLHLDCATKIQHWSDESEEYLKIGDVNATISAESPLWPGMTPLLVAAALSANSNLIKCLLDLDADPIIRDLEGNTALHYLFRNDNNDINDERLFAFDGRETFGPIFGGTHFHIACRNCPDSLEIVKRYLDQGVSPDLPMKGPTAEYDIFGIYDVGKVALHLAGEVGRGRFCTCSDLVQLLLEYGADVNKKDIRDRTPLKYFLKCVETYNHDEFIKCICLLIDAGSIEEELDTEEQRHILSETVLETKEFFLASIKKLIILEENLVAKVWKDLYREIADNSSNDWNEAEFISRCLDELEALTRLGLRAILDGTVTLTDNFKSKFGSTVDSFYTEGKSYPIYSNLLKLKFKRKLLEYEKKKNKVGQAAAKVQCLFQKHGSLPHVCAEKILWKMSDKDLTLFINGDIFKA